ncbi:MAG TPA: hypothetical protein VMS04_15620 [Vicinamibacterales bacterium]|jgi:hypothetical protein|nr:hypothetical protein [Vicinamibacterales bacterium]
MWTFGAGVLIATPQSDASGNALTPSSPVEIGILQEVGVSFDFESKELYGANQFPVDVGRGKGKAMVKAKFARINAELFNSVFYGQTLTAGYEALFHDLTGTQATGGTGGITVTPPSSGAFALDQGVQDGNGVPYTRVATGPTGGQYEMTGSGNYIFSTQDQGKTVFVSYAYTSTAITAAKKLTVVNLPMGYQPSFMLQFMAQKNGKTWWVEFPNAVCNKMDSTFKNDDFTIPDAEFACFADTNGNISYQSWSE